MTRSLALVGLLLIALPVHSADWTYNMAFIQWGGSNDADRFYTNTPEECEARAAAIAAAGYTAVICSGYHFRLNWLERDEGVRDVMRMIVDACHRHGLKVIEHMDLTIVYYDAYPLAWANPDWFQLHAADMMTRHRIFCLNNPDFQRFYVDYAQQWQRETGLDAWQMDEVSWVGGRGFCGCRWCREKWRAEKGRDYPAIEAPGFFDAALADPEYREWMQWRGKSINDFYDVVREGLTAINPDVQIFDYTTASQSSPGSWTRGAPYDVQVASVDTIGTELNPVPFQSYPYIADLLAQRRALGEASGTTNWAKFDITRPSAYFCWAFGRTVGHSIWWSLQPDNEDPRPQDLLNWPWQMDDQSARLDPDIGVLLSGSTRDLDYDFDYYDTEFRGWMQALLLGPFAARPIIESELTEPGALDRYRLIVLPNATAISPEQKTALMDYVRAGGKLLLTYEAGTRNHDGTPSDDPLLTEAGVTLLEGNLSTETLPEGWPDIPVRRVAIAEDALVVHGFVPNDPRAAPLITLRQVGDGEIWYAAVKGGKLAYETSQLPGNYARGGGYKPPLVPEAIGGIQDVAAQILGDAPHFSVEGLEATGLLATVYRAERDGRPARCIHLLNCTGRSLREGDEIAFDHDNPPPMPPLPQLTLRLPGGVAEAVLATPERPEPLTLTAVAAESVTMVTIPAESFSTYAVVWAYDE
ncbi:MAG: hypothetical protein GX131_17790 [candidate division WS1 bacterium]|nr:hypothetical protein [candidate division WS1 bacterium]